jgi:dUTP pyrophosphatase
MKVYPFLSYNLMYHNAKFENKHEDNAGYDLFPLQSDDVNNIVIHPNEVLKIYTGVRLAIPQGYWGEIKERGSTGVKGIEVRAGVVDCNYRGEIIVVVSNSTDAPIEHDLKKAIAQIVIQKYETCVLSQLDRTYFDEMKTERGDKGFGSTDKQ